MDPDSINQFRTILGILKDLMAVQSRHADVIDGLVRSYSGLLATLGGSGGPEEPRPSPEAQQAALSRAAREIAELERIFRSGDAS